MWSCSETVLHVAKTFKKWENVRERERECVQACLCVCRYCVDSCAVIILLWRVEILVSLNYYNRYNTCTVKDQKKDNKMYIKTNSCFEFVLICLLLYIETLTNPKNVYFTHLKHNHKMYIIVLTTVEHIWTQTLLEKAGVWQKTTKKKNPE